MGETLKLELNIRALILEGFKPGHGNRIGVSVETTLTRLFEERGLPPGLANDCETAGMAVGPVEIAPDDRPEVIGGQIASAIYEGLSK